MTDGPRALSEVFDRCAAEDRAALIGYFPAGYPSVEESVRTVTDMVEAGCDIVEVGIAYSDPMMDGPTIQDAVTTALAAGVRTRDAFALVRAVRKAGGVPVVMSYYNPILRYGVDAFARDLAEAGGAGVITPDLIPDEAEQWMAASDVYGLARIFLVAPSSTPERLAMTVSKSSGFLYAVSVMGVTGARAEVTDVPRILTQRVKDVSDIPVGVGLGVRNGDQAAEIGAYADGVIVGSALIAAADHGRDAVIALTKDLAAGVRRART